MREGAFLIVRTADIEDSGDIRVGYALGCGAAGDRFWGQWREIHG